MKLVILDASTIGSKQELALFTQFGDVDIYETTSTDERIPHIGNAEIVITNKVIIDTSVMERCPHLQLVCVTATGVNNVDLESAEKHKILIKNAKAYSTQSVAQHTLTCLLYLNSRLGHYIDYTASGQYSSNKLFTYLGPEFHNLQGKTVGIIGLGAIGRKVAQLLDALGCKICYYSTTGKNTTTDYQRLPLEQLLAESDIVTIHAPLTDATYKLISSKELALMKKTAILINMGRGGIVDEHDLSKALSNNEIASACLDVFESEPLPINSPLFPFLKTEKLIITPHIAWASVQARKRLLEITAQNIRHYNASKE